MADPPRPSVDQWADEVAQSRKRVVVFFSANARPQDADDLANATILRVLQRIQTGEAVASVGAFTLGVARKVLLEYYRRMKKERETTANVDDLVAHGADPADRSHGDLPAQRHGSGTEPDRRRFLAKCFRELSGDQRDLLARYFADGTNKHNRAALASSLGISRGALHSRASNLYRRVRACRDACLRDAAA